MKAIIRVIHTPYRRSFLSSLLVPLKSPPRKILSTIRTPNPIAICPKIRKSNSPIEYKTAFEKDKNGIDAIVMSIIKKRKCIEVLLQYTMLESFKKRVKSLPEHELFATIAKEMKKLLFILFFALLISGFVPNAHAQGVNIRDIITDEEESTDEAQLATESSRLASPSAEEIAQIEELKKRDLTKPEEEKDEVFALFANRPAEKLTATNFVAYAIQYSVRQGVPANTIMLIMLLPLLATIVAFFRHVIGVPSIGLLVPIALSITFVATGLTAGIVLLIAIILGSTFSRMLLKKVRIMQLPKMALSIFVVSVFVLIALTATAVAGILTVRQLSIFPILLLILLSERIVSLQIERSSQETLKITAVTMVLGIIGFLLLSSGILRQVVLLYPETVLLLIPINILIGRYFGLRFTEFVRFTPINRNANK
jgi:hypothetical protein